MQNFYRGDTVVMKFGSEVVASKAGPKIAVIETIADQVARLINIGVRPIIVSSGAILTGRSLVGNKIINTNDTATKQALSAIGQPVLMKAFHDALNYWDIQSGQVLVDWANFKDKTERDTLDNAFLGLRSLGAIPIVNENDAVATEEFATDNDMIAAEVALLLGARSLLLVSDGISGLEDDQGIIIPRLTTEDGESALSLVRPMNGSDIGRGGMYSKLDSSLRVARFGVSTLIMGSGDITRISSEAFTGSFGTRIVSDPIPANYNLTTL